MAAMKVTTSAAMRARDVSRPHAQHLAYAEAAEASAASSRPAGPAVAADATVSGSAAVSGNAAVSGSAGGPGPVLGDEAFTQAGAEDQLGNTGRADGGRSREGQRSDGASGRAGGGRRWRSRGSGRGRASR